MGGEDDDQNTLDIVEVIDGNTDCKVNDFPIRLYMMSGINGTICGGERKVSSYGALSSCWYLNPNGTWTPDKDILESRVLFSMNKVDDQIFVIGGRDPRTGSPDTGNNPSSIEKYSLVKDNGWSRMRDAPIWIYGHCTVLFNASNLFITGGHQHAHHYTPV